MKSLNDWIGLVAAILILGFALVWLFAPDQKQEIQDWWYGMTVDCPQMQDQLASDQRCRMNDDCELGGKESTRAEELELQYSRYCSSK